MRKVIRKIVVGTVSVLALSIAGIVLNYAADGINTVNPAPSVSYAMDISQPPANRQSGDTRFAQQQLRKDSIRWAQVELRTRGVYKGSLDGVLGPETKRALTRFQMDNGLSQTASLDAHTWEALTGDTNVGVGSSIAPDAPASDLGR